MKVKEDDDNTENAPQSLNVNEGQMFQNSICNLVEKWTSSPKHYTEDTLLSAMETAGQRDVASMPDSVGLSENEELVKIGIGTPATRAGVIELLLRKGFITRQKKNLLSTEKGVYYRRRTSQKNSSIQFKNQPLFLCRERLFT